MSFDPLEALRAIRCVCGDVCMSPAQRLAVVSVILRAENGTGKAWAGYRSITAETGLAPATIRDGLKRAEGRYLRRCGVGRHGTTQYQALQPVKRVSTNESPSASQNEAPALQSALASASTREDKLTPVSNPTTNPSKKRAADKPPPDPRVKEFIDWFASRYHEVRGRPYVVVGGKDGATVKRLLRQLDLDELKAAAEAMLADPFWRDKADMGVLASKVNQFRRATAASASTAGKGMIPWTL